jgi:hypothetical protein
MHSSIKYLFSAYHKIGPLVGSKNHTSCPVGDLTGESDNKCHKQMCSDNCDGVQRLKGIHLLEKSRIASWGSEIELKYEKRSRATMAKRPGRRAPVAYTCNPSYSGAKD